MDCGGDEWYGWHIEKWRNTRKEWSMMFFNTLHLQVTVLAGCISVDTSYSELI